MMDIDIRCYMGTEINIIDHSRNSFTGAFDGNGKKIREPQLEGLQIMPQPDTANTARTRLYLG